MDPHAAVQLRRLGGTPEEHTSRQLRADDVGSADVVVTATRKHRSQVLTVSPQHLHRAFTLVELADLLSHAQGDTLPELIQDASRQRGGTARLTAEELDIIDPIGQSSSVHMAVADRIDAEVERIVDVLATVRPPL